jgi:hypothetical protein
MAVGFDYMEEPNFVKDKDKSIISAIIIDEFQITAV